MGSSFANLFVRAEGDEAVDRVVAAVRDLLLAEPGVELVDGGVADREVLIGRVAPTWIGIFDEAADRSLEEEVIAPLASAASRAAEAVAVATAVFDSDLAQLWLVEGEIVDRVARPTHVFTELAQGPIDAWNGRPDLWRERLPGVAAGDLPGAWDTDDDFAEARVLETARLLGIPEPYATSGLRYLQENGADTATFERVAVRVAAAAQPSGDFAGVSWWGEPAIHPQVSADEPDPGEAFPAVRVARPCTLLAGVQLVGSASRELLVVVGGEALDDGLVRLDEVTAGGALQLVQGRPATVPFEDGRVDGRSVRFATVPIAGASARPSSYDAAGSAAQVAIIQADMDSIVMLNVAGLGLKPGSSQLWIAVGPVDRFEAGQTTAVVTVRVEP